MLGGQIDRIEAEAAGSPEIVPGVKPHLVFRVPVAPGTSASAIVRPLATVGITVLNVESDNAVIAFRDDADLSQFRSALQNYRTGPQFNPGTGKTPASTKWDVFENIEADEMRNLTAADRIGRRLAVEIGANAAGVEVDRLYILDVELWHPGLKQLAR